MVPKVLELPFVPTAIEFLERELIDIVERTLNKPFPVQQGEAVLIVMYDALQQTGAGQRRGGCRRVGPGQRSL